MTVVVSSRATRQKSEYCEVRPVSGSGQSLRSRSPPSYRRIERIKRVFQCALAPALVIRALLGSCARRLVAVFDTESLLLPLDKLLRLVRRHSR
jgi:hypothetical protein